MASRLQVTKHGDVLLIRFMDHKLVGDLPIQLGQEFYGLATQEDCAKILLSFSGVDFLASDMLSAVISLNKTMKNKKGRLVLCEICLPIRQILATTKLDTLLAVQGTEADGLSALA